MNNSSTRTISDFLFRNTAFLHKPLIPVYEYIAIKRVEKIIKHTTLKNL